MKIAICTNFYSPSTGGAETVTKVIAEYLNKFHEVVILTRRLAGRDQRNFDYQVVEYRPGDIISFEEKIKHLKPDVVFIYSDVFDFFRQLVIGEHAFKLIIALCGANWLYSHRNFVNILGRNLSNIHSIICHSTLERDYKLCSSPNFQKKTFIIPNGVLTEEFDNNKLTRNDLAPKLYQKRWILNVSNFFPGKGQEHLIDILARLPNPEQIAYIQISSDIDFEIGQTLEHKWKVAAKKLKSLGMKVKFLKNLPREEVIGYFKQSNVFAFTSEKEVAPLVLLECMASSLPWLSTNVGNAANLQGGMPIVAIKDRRFHSVFDERVKNLFVENIQKLWSTPKVGEDGRLQIEKELNWNKILPQYLSLVESLYA